MQQRVYKFRLKNVDELKQRFIDVWNGLQQNVMTTWPSSSEERDVKHAYAHTAQGEYFELTEKSRVQRKSFVSNTRFRN